MIRDQDDLLAHYPEAALRAGEVELSRHEQPIRLQWLPLIRQVRIPCLILGMEHPAAQRAALLEAINAANSELGHAVFHLPNALFAKHTAFLDDAHGIPASVLDASIELVASAARGFGGTLRAIALGSTEKVETLEDRSRRLARALLDAMDD